MGPISPETQTLIDQLNQRRSFWETLTGSRDDEGLLSEIGDSNEPAAITGILPFALSAKRDIAKAAAVAVHKLTRSITSSELAWLDSAVRKLSPYWGSDFYAWHKMSPDQLGLLERFAETSVSLLGMASFHRSGHVRQAAIERLDLISTGVELPYIVLRLNDWVSNVRDVAYTATRSRLKPEYAPSLIANLALVSRLEAASRADHQDLTRAINELLQSDACRTALLESLKSEDRFIRRASFRVAFSSSINLPELARWALIDRDTVVRLWAAQKVASTLTGKTLEQLLELMKRDRFMPVRREALRCYARQGVERAPEELISALLDTNASMREEARYHLQKIATMDVAAFYRETVARVRSPRVSKGNAALPSIAANTDLYSAICGLGETGSETDVHLIVSYASDAVAKIREAAVKALARLNAKAHVELFLTALTDEGPRVSRQALKALAGMTGALSGEQVWAIFAAAPRGHVKRNALSLLERLPKWDSIFYLLRAIRDGDEAVAVMSRFGIQRWLARFNRTFNLPSSDQIAKVKAALAEGDELLDEKTKEQILFSIKSS
jgi:HEAT repeat protein